MKHKHTGLAQAQLVRWTVYTELRLAEMETLARKAFALGENMAGERIALELQKTARVYARVLEMDGATLHAIARSN